MQEVEIRDFDNYMRDTSMTILKHKDRDYTWKNRHTYSRIDWALVNTKWMLNRPNLEVQILDPGCSDHSPLSINFSQQEEMRPRPFKFLKHLAKHVQFQEIVKNAWQDNQIGNGMRKVWQKLKRVKQVLKMLNTTEFKGVETRIKLYRQ
ncbi:hypothetical protein R3W88_000573 [Solanum pinnatisectum]|uniref:Endonuclease/exonuclease/phosphatase domain-containing protein n=1 Tax=Solanum pinnatisectum TaxID=50273 RepID=A0AAV9MGA8_9SOLN|nr:hypothetical protein R3W88_000573 [Solanum pinnatisectum]